MGHTRGTHQRSGVIPERKKKKMEPRKTYYRKAAEWLGTTLDEVLEGDSEIDLEHLSRGHHL